jgi:glutamate synthase domain-containing protein 2
MAKEPRHIDISGIPELLKLVHEVRQTNEPTIFTGGA